VPLLCFSRKIKSL